MSSTKSVGRLPASLSVVSTHVCWGGWPDSVFAPQLADRATFSWAIAPAHDATSPLHMTLRILDCGFGFRTDSGHQRRIPGDYDTPDSGFEGRIPGGGAGFRMKLILRIPGLRAGFRVVGPESG